MTFHLKAAVLTAGIACVFSFSTAQASDAFAQACTARGKASAAHCACESKLARASLDAREQAATIRAMQGDADGFRASLASMGEAKAQSFIAKLQKLKTQTDQQCR